MSLTLVQKQRIQEWIAALRPGKYKQATDLLKTEAGYCCLGVACEISNLGKWEYNIANNLCYEINKDVASSTSMPFDVTKYFGLENSRGLMLSDVYSREDQASVFEQKMIKDQTFLRAYTEVRLDVLNDSGEFTFSMIADIIQYWIDNITIEE